MVPERTVLSVLRGVRAVTSVPSAHVALVFSGGAEGRRGGITAALANSRTLKPFFSSTFSDFTAEREHLALGQEGRGRDGRHEGDHVKHCQWTARHEAGAGFLLFDGELAPNLTNIPLGHSLTRNFAFWGMRLSFEQAPH